MLSHVSLGTNDAARRRVLRSGPRRARHPQAQAAWGVDRPRLCDDRSLEQPVDGQPASAGNGGHIAFIAESRAQVDEFYRVALAHDTNSSAAFVRDPGGNKIEAVTFLAK